jgi:hypothetical protein
MRHRPSRRTCSILNTTSVRACFPSKSRITSGRMTCSETTMKSPESERKNSSQKSATCSIASMRGTSWRSTSLILDLVTTTSRMWLRYSKRPSKSDITQAKIGDSSNQYRTSYRNALLIALMNHIFLIFIEQECFNQMPMHENSIKLMGLAISLKTSELGVFD